MLRLAGFRVGLNRTFSSYAGRLAKVSAQALDRPLGFAEPPKASDNTGIDQRTLAQIGRDLTDYDRNQEQRKEIEYEFSRGLSQIHKYNRNVGGKFFASPPAYFRPDKALYMPNFYGTVVATGDHGSTTPVLQGKVSIVRIYSVLSGELETKTYFDQDPNTLVSPHFQMVDVLLPDTFVKEWLMRMFMGNLRKQFPDPDRQSRVFICRKGVNRFMRQALLADNPYGGFVYLVDRDCKVRWAASGRALDTEKTNLLKFARAVAAE